MRLVGRLALATLLATGQLLEAQGAKKKGKKARRQSVSPAFASADKTQQQPRQHFHDASGIFRVAGELARVGRLTEAEAAYEAVLTQPDNAAGDRHIASRTNLAGLQAQTNRLDEAVNNWERAIAMAERSGFAAVSTIQARFNRARALGMMGPQRLGEAEAALREGVAIDPSMLDRFVFKKNDPTDING